MTKELLTWLFFWGSWFWSIIYMVLFDIGRIGCKKGYYPVVSIPYFCITSICLALFYKHSKYYGSTVSDIFDLSKALSFERTGDLILFGVLILSHTIMAIRFIKRFYIFYRSGRENIETNN